MCSAKARNRSQRSGVRRGALLACGFLLLAFPLWGQGEAIFAFRDVHVVDVVRGVSVPRQTVIVRGSRIDEIGPVRQVSIPGRAHVIRGPGYLMAGLSDMHMHLNEEVELDIYLAKGITTARVMAGWRRWRELRDAVNAGEVLGPRLFVASPITDGVPPFWEDAITVSTPEEAREIVRIYRRLGYDFVKIYGGLPADLTQIIFRTGQRQGIPVVGHLPWSLSLREGLEGGMASMEHLIGLANAVESPSSPTYGLVDARHLLGAVEIEKERLPEVAAEIAGSDTWICPTLVAIDRFVHDDVGDALMARPQTKYVNPERRDWWLHGGRDVLNELISGVSEEELALGRENRREFVAALGEAGAKVLVGSDAGSWYVVPGFSLHVELRNYVSAGWTPAAILAAATVGTAEFLGLSDEMGTVESGKRADLVLLRKDPLVDVRNAAKIKGVMVNGRWLPRAELNAMLARVAKQFADPPGN